MQPQWETEILVDVYADVKPFLRTEGIKAIEEQGAFVKGEDGEWETPLVNGSECAYVVISENGITKCGLEEAYNQGATQWKKPVSCHLYPIRVKEYTELTAVNYHRWQICDSACSLGEELKVPIYKFVKEVSSGSPDTVIGNCYIDKSFFSSTYFKNYVFLSFF